VLVVAISQAAAWDISLIGIFFVLFPALISGLLLIAIVQARGERRRTPRRARRDDL
jgi:hypothetical protein